MTVLTQRQRRGRIHRLENIGNQRVDARDKGRCCRCGNDVGEWWSRQHRLARGSGGSSDPVIASAANKVTLCGSATTGCHGWVELYRLASRPFGWSLLRGDDPLTHPVLWFGRWVLLDESGGVTDVSDPRRAA